MDGETKGDGDGADATTGVPGEHVLLGGKHAGKSVATVAAFDPGHMKWVSTHARSPEDRAAARAFLAATPAPTPGAAPASDTTPAAASEGAGSEPPQAAQGASSGAPAAGGDTPAAPMDAAQLQAVLDANPALAAAIREHFGPTVQAQPTPAGFDPPPTSSPIAPAPAAPQQQPPFAPEPFQRPPQHQLTPYQLQMLEAARKGGVGEVAQKLNAEDAQRAATGQAANVVQGGRVPPKGLGDEHIGGDSAPAPQPTEAAPVGAPAPGQQPPPGHTYEQAVEMTQGHLVQPPVQQMPDGVQVIEVKPGSSVLTPWGTVRCGPGARLCSDDPLIWCTYRGQAHDERHKFWVSHDQTSPLTPVHDPVVASQLAAVGYHRYQQVQRAPVAPPPAAAPGAPPPLSAPPPLAPHGMMNLPQRF